MKALILSILFTLIILAGNALAQKRPPMIKVCGDPAAACSKRALFDDDDLPFEYTDNTPVAESAPFYVVILKSVKLSENADCEKVPDGFSRKEFQWNFPNNKVFIARGCYSIENNYYTKIGDNVIAIAVYAGTSKAVADKFLKKVKSLEYIDVKDAYILRISTGFNGT